MTEVFPNYYDKFKCIADKCEHNCCIGWEIDIDQGTIKKYKSLEKDTGFNFADNIEENHFKLKDGERCAFLNSHGLCDIICSFGEDALCDICTLHPRFKNFYTHFNEVGLGLSCEEAARIILSAEERFCIFHPECVLLTDEEKDFFKERSTALDILQNRSKTITERFSYLARKYEAEITADTEKLLEIYTPLERLDEKWTDELEALRGFFFDGKIFEKFPIAFENLAVYFIFRHFGKCIWDYEPAVRFALQGCTLIGAMLSCCESDGKAADFRKLVDLARMYSAEIEYSDENTEEIMFELT